MKDIKIDYGFIKVKTEKGWLIVNDNRPSFLDDFTGELIDSVGNIAPKWINDLLLYGEEK